MKNQRFLRCELIMLAPLVFERLNETDVREEVIAPLLRRLGYVSGTENDVIREQLLRYPKVSLGRKNSSRDPELRGKADYVLDVQSRLRWTIEAKAPSVAVGVDDIEQAWTYANHPEIRAIYFVLCNGRMFGVYRTQNGPRAEAVLSLSYAELDHKFLLVDNLLGPEALLRDFPHMEIDTGTPLAPGLRSIARITNGIVQFENNSVGSAALNELRTTIRNGAVDRDERGRLVVFVKTESPFRYLQELNERLGLSSFEMNSEAESLSTDTQNPTLLVYDNRVTLPAGETLLDFLNWRKFTLPANLSCDVSAKASGTYHDGVFSGVFTTDIGYCEMGMRVTLSGSFEISLA